MKIYISTGLEKDIKTLAIAKKFIKKGINKIEFSSGNYEKNILKKIKKLNIDAQIHNYFPVPKKAFIINLASKNNKIFIKTMNHLKRSINFSSKIKAKYFSFHAGFLVDPNLKDFGKTLERNIVNDHSKCLELFIKRLNILANYAKKKNVKILIENNVITKKNLSRFNKNPFIMSSYVDAFKIMKKCGNNNVGLLVDVAHLKVSAKTLKFKPEDYLIKLDKYIKGYHLSDNNGLADENKNVTTDSWFWKYIKKDKDFCTLELKNLKITNVMKQLNLVKKKIKYEKNQNYLHIRSKIF